MRITLILAHYRANCVLQTTSIRNIEICIKKTDNIWLVSIYFVFLISVCCEDSAIQRFDGWYNNLAYPSWGTTGQYARCITVLI